MKVVVQRVISASVTVEGRITGQISKGIMVLLGVEKGDNESKADWLVEKMINLRIFSDSEGKMNLGLKEVGGGVLVVSQFTLAGNCAKGKRPSFDSAAPASEGKRLYDYFVESAGKQGVPVETGIFQADMQVALVNDGPVTFILEK